VKGWEESRRRGFGGFCLKRRKNVKGGRGKVSICLGQSEEGQGQDSKDQVRLPGLPQFGNDVTRNKKGEKKKNGGSLRKGAGHIEVGKV